MTENSTWKRDMLQFTQKGISSKLPAAITGGRYLEDCWIIDLVPFP